MAYAVRTRNDGGKGQKQQVSPRHEGVRLGAGGFFFVHNNIAGQRVDGQLADDRCVE
jgi:hypothetical protein